MAGVERVEPKRLAKERETHHASTASVPTRFGRARRPPFPRHWHASCPFVSARASSSPACHRVIDTGRSSAALRVRISSACIIIIIIVIVVWIYCCMFLTRLCVCVFFFLGISLSEMVIFVDGRIRWFWDGM